MSVSTHFEPPISLFVSPVDNFTAIFRSLQLTAVALSGMSASTISGYDAAVRFALTLCFCWDRNRLGVGRVVFGWNRYRRCLTVAYGL